jgi:hypothetical protein
MAAARSDVGWPLRFDARGRTAEVDYDGHVRDMVDLLLFTSPGERVMRPDFGCGLLDLVFEGNSPELAATVHMTIQAQLERWLGDVIEIGALEVESEEVEVRVRLAYRVLATGSQRFDVFEGRARA